MDTDGTERAALDAVAWFALGQPPESPPTVTALSTEIRVNLGSAAICVPFNHATMNTNPPWVVFQAPDGAVDKFWMMYLAAYMETPAYRAQVEGTPGEDVTAEDLIPLIEQYMYAIRDHALESARAAAQALTPSGSDG